MAPRSRESWARIVAFALANVLAARAAAVVLHPGDLVAMGAAGSGLFAVSPFTGSKLPITTEVFSDFGVGVGGSLYGLSGSSLRSIDPETGSSSLVSSGGLLTDPIAIEVGTDGTLYVLDVDPSGAGRVLGIDPADGSQFLVADGGLLADPLSPPFFDIALSANGNAVLVKADSLVILVDLATGAQSAFADLASGFFGNGGLGEGPDGSVYAVSFGQCECVGVRDPTTGEMMTIFGMRTPSGGSLLLPTDVAVAFNGPRLFVTGTFIVVDGLPFGGPTLLAVDLPAPINDPFSDRIHVLATDVVGEVEVVPVPEPGSAAMLPLGVALFSLHRHKLRTRRVRRLDGR